MKKTLITAITVAALSASTAYAGGLSDPVLEEDLIEDATSSSDGRLLVPLLFIVFGGAVLAG